MLNEVYKAAKSKLVGTTFYLLHTGGYIQTNPLTSLVMAPTCSYCSTCSPSILIPQLGFQENDTLRSGILYILHINTPRWVIWIQSISVGICWWLSGSAYILRRYNKPPKWCPGITLRCVDQQRSNIWEQPNDVQNKCITLRKRKQQQQKTPVPRESTWTAPTLSNPSKDVLFPSEKYYVGLGQTWSPIPWCNTSLIDPHQSSKKWVQTQFCFYDRVEL